ncbi:amidohydrolase family protein [Aurantibacter sp.]|uniref:amidohydrolase family protein n=1 Tax=Aurantibacter sp. TaxID=2807103 RepID=UPI003267FD05
MKNTTILFLVILTLFACKPKVAKESEEINTIVSLDKQSIKKVDIHTHFEFDRDYLPDFFEEWNMQGMLVDVAHHTPEGVGRSWNEYVALQKKYPDLFWLCSSLIGAGIDDPEFTEKEIARLLKEIEQGAKMVKVWKNFGMITKDNSGKFIQIDDERLQPIFDFLAAKGIAVMAHIAEPIQAWRPLDDPKNPHYGYYNEHPEYHAFKHSEIPTYETIIAARDNWISNNPDLKIICAHMGSMSHDVDMIAERLDKFDNLYVEPAARFGDLVGQDEEKVRVFFGKYQDRIMFGTDFGNHIQQDSLNATKLEEERAYLEEEYALRWQYLSTTDSVEIRSQKSEGLGLSEEILQKVYYQNFADFFEVQ